LKGKHWLSLKTIDSNNTIFEVLIWEINLYEISSLIKYHRNKTKIESCYHTLAHFFYKTIFHSYLQEKLI